MTVKHNPEVALRRARTKLKKATANFRREVSDLAMILGSGCDGWGNRGSDTWAHNPSVLIVLELEFIATKLGEILDTEDGLEMLSAAFICRAIGEIGASRIALHRFDLWFPRTGTQSSVPVAIAAHEAAVDVLYFLTDVEVRARDVRYIDALQAA